jgi:hypothetical protein
VQSWTGSTVATHIHENNPVTVPTHWSHLMSRRDAILTEWLLATCLGTASRAEHAHLILCQPNTFASISNLCDSFVPASLHMVQLHKGLHLAPAGRPHHAHQKSHNQETSTSTGVPRWHAHRWWHVHGVNHDHKAGVQRQHLLFTVFRRHVPDLGMNRAICSASSLRRCSLVLAERPSSAALPSVASAADLQTKLGCEEIQPPYVAGNLETPG